TSEGMAPAIPNQAPEALLEHADWVAALAARLVAEGAAAVVVDCETSYVRLGLADDLARHLNAPSVRLDQLRADSLTALVRVQADRGAA
ncbi:MAG: hypothetical protein ACPGVG_04030, partial [Mycobacterium sp.]